MSRLNHRRPDETFLQMSASTSRLPSVSRAMSSMLSRSNQSQESLAAEFVGGPMRWRFIEDDPLMEDESEAEHVHRREMAQKPWRPANQPYMHEMTLAAGWGEQSKRQKKIKKTITRLGYCPGLPRQKSWENPLNSWLPPEYRAGAFSNFRPSPPPPQRKRHTEVHLETRDHLQLLELPPDGDVLVAKRWGPGYFLKPSRTSSPQTSYMSHSTGHARSTTLASDSIEVTDITA
eukprot:TRINITY_DN19052_c0_g1_i2.p1 TRINITY_DN19052_c0_g1~~TRINITY_DN19052_c0_g1_i2.p1  ORF type:complete len:233 (-),score=38.20 TRINITY_DN19052_c0_g1_i2:103-801(-)